MKKFLVIGNPIEHSLSPELHNYWMKNNGIDAIYEKQKLNENELEQIIFKVKDKKIISERIKKIIVKKTGIGDKAYFGPEPEFFVFDDVRFKNDMNETSFMIDSSEGPYNTGRRYENGNMGHRPGVKGGYFPVPPVDSAQDMRGEYLKALKDMGVKWKNITMKLLQVNMS